MSLTLTRAYLIAYGGIDTKRSTVKRHYDSTSSPPFHEYSLKNRFYNMVRPGVRFLVFRHALMQILARRTYRRTTRGQYNSPNKMTFTMPAKYGHFTHPRRDLLVYWARSRFLLPDRLRSRRQMHQSGWAIWHRQRDAVNKLAVRDLLLSSSMSSYYDRISSLKVWNLPMNEYCYAYLTFCH